MFKIDAVLGFLADTDLSVDDATGDVLLESGWLKLLQSISFRRCKIVRVLGWQSRLR